MLRAVSPKVGERVISVHLATDDRQCSRIGMDVLREGGNAVDASVVAALCLEVVPASNTRWSQIDDHDASHLSVIDPQENAISMTSTVNGYFGAHVLSNDSTIQPPAPTSFIRPGKRPLSSMTPAIVLKFIVQRMKNLRENEGTREIVAVSDSRKRRTPLPSSRTNTDDNRFPTPKMGSVNNKARPFSAQHHQQPLCTRTHQIGALLLVAATFFFTSLLNRSFRPCASHFPAVDLLPNSWSSVQVTAGRDLLWPQRGYGPQLDLKIYVYDDREIDGLKALMRGRDGVIDPKACLKGQWGTQVKIHRLLLNSRFRTRKKDEADLFFVPTYTKCVRMMGGLNDKEINQTYVKVLSQMPYFRRSGGRDHIFVFPSGAGAHLFRSWATFINRSIILTPEGDRTDKKDTSAFNTWKDIIIPGNVEDGMTTNGPALVHPLPISKRKYLANYLGRAQGKAGRLKLIELSKKFPDKLECPELKFSGPEKLGRIDYFEHLRNAKFCLAPRGESSWTLRFYEAFFVECVPVILSDQVELPFQNVVDYTQISIKWPSTLIGPELLQYLESLPDKNIEGMISRGRQVRCLWAYASESASCSAMHGILWELQRKVRLFHQSTETFWLHNGSVVNRNLVEFSDWRPPMPLP
ncbi:glucuronosyltransferase [Pyrus ussuriensis x Pyrus communis]|uniref:Glucuronosyltransferase n=1 Tax=Pyrus ussuriensis x Pyrus communis TaxID=2448454 RepID=A0A5N5FQI9_9ROSA|nr:glucuronosyltransferase [Pyrus ussuriensis x Pyrus communis]